MMIRKLSECKEFISGDGAMLRELLNARTDKVRLGYSLAHAVVRPKSSTKPHKLKASEVYYILEGIGIMHIEDHQEIVGKGSMVYIPPGSVQYIENRGKTRLFFLCIVDPGWSPDDEEIL